MNIERIESNGAEITVILTFNKEALRRSTGKEALSVSFRELEALCVTLEDISRVCIGEAGRLESINENDKLMRERRESR